MLRNLEFCPLSNIHPSNVKILFLALTAALFTFIRMNSIMQQYFKQFIIAVFAAAFAYDACAQNELSAERKLGTQAIGVEVMGSTGLVGASYDARFRPGANSGWGFRTGLNYSLSAFGRSKSEPDTWQLTFTGGCGVPVEVNYLTGKDHSHFEVGLGCTLGVYRDEWEEVICANPSQHDSWTPGALNARYGTHCMANAKGTAFPCDRIEKSSRTAFGYYAYLNVGYRYQRPNGFMFRAGISPQFGFTKGAELSWPFTPLYQWPYVAAGWTF